MGDQQIFDYQYESNPLWWVCNTGSRCVKFNIISYHSFLPYSDIVEQTRLFLKSLSSNYFLDSIHNYLSSITGTSNNLAYGYCHLPGIPLDDFYQEREIEVISQLLTLGLDPTGTDRWGRSFHTMFLLTAKHWDILFNGYCYPLISSHFYFSPLFLFLVRLVPSFDLSFGSLNAIILSEERLIQILTNIKCKEILKHIELNKRLYQKIIFKSDFIINQRQIDIIFDILISFINKLDLMNQIKYSPPFGKFPGGIKYHSSYIHFLSLR